MAVDALSKVKEPVLRVCLSMVCDTDMKCEKMYSEEVKSVRSRVPGRKASGLWQFRSKRRESRACPS